MVIGPGCNWNKDDIVVKIAPFLTKQDIYDPDLKDLLNWQIISEFASEDVLVSILEDKKDDLSWEIVSKRISNSNDCDLSLILLENESVADYLNWSILSSQMALAPARDTTISLNARRLASSCLMYSN